MPHSQSDCDSMDHELVNGDRDHDSANDSSSAFLSSTVPTLDIHKGRQVRLQVKVMVPVHDHPNFNFVGKLLGPKGNSLKWLQEQTQTKMAILGRGSMRDKQKEENLRKQFDPKYSHLNEDLHVEITAFAPAPEAYIRMGNALHEVKRFLVPDYYDEIRQQQLRELGILNVDKKPCNNKLRVNDCPPARPAMRDIDQAAIHQIPSNGSCNSAVTPPHLVSPSTNGCNSSNECNTPYTTMNRENDAELSQYWESKSNFKLTARHNNHNNNNNSSTKGYHDKPYSRPI